MNSKIDNFIKIAIVVTAIILILSGIGAIPFGMPNDLVNTFVSYGSIMLLIIYVFPRLRDLTFGNNRIRLDSNSHEFASNIARELGPQITSLASDTRFINHQRAFHDAIAVIKDSITRQNDPLSEIDLRLISVAMRFSFNFFNRELVPIVKDYPNVQFVLRVAVINPDYLAQFDLDTKEFDWNHFSRDLPAKIIDLDNQLHVEGITNLTIETFYYEGFPQYHGLMVNREHLYTGITDWDWNTQSGKPRLTVGSNEYRYFNSNSQIGKKRIELFRHWFTYCSKHSSLKQIPNSATSYS